MILVPMVHYPFVKMGKVSGFADTMIARASLASRCAAQYARYLSRTHLYENLSMNASVMTMLLRSASTLFLGFLLIGNDHFAEAAKPSAHHTQSIQSKAAKGGRKHSGKSNRHKLPAAGLDRSEAGSTLESAIENCETVLAVIANNIANAETPGFKRSRPIIEDLAYRQERLPGVQDSSGMFSPNGFSIGSGSQIAGTEIDFRQGRLKRTGRELDLAIEGRGFFQLRDPSGTIVFCRAGHFAQNSNGQIVIGSAKTGRVLEPAITIPNDATSISINAEGVVSCRTPSSQHLQEVGTVQMAKFVNPEGLLQTGENLYEETDGSGTCQTGNPGSDGFGKIWQGWVERSNVDLREEISEWNRVRRVCRELRAIVKEE